MSVSALAYSSVAPPVRAVERDDSVALLQAAEWKNQSVCKVDATVCEAMQWLALRKYGVRVASRSLIRVPVHT